MICENQKEYLNQFIDGELDISGQIRLFQHLAGCQECRSFIDAAVRMKEIIRTEQVLFPPEIDEKVISRLPHSRGTSGSFWRRKFSVSFPLAAAFILVTILLGVIIGRVFEPGQITGLPAGDLQIRSARPTTVIMIYSVPAVEIVGNVPYQKVSHPE